MTTATKRNKKTPTKPNRTCTIVVKLDPAQKAQLDELSERSMVAISRIVRFALQIVIEEPKRLGSGL